jgi:hypothetical protein
LERSRGLEEKEIEKIEKRWESSSPLPRYPFIFSKEEDGKRRNEEGIKKRRKEGRGRKKEEEGENDLEAGGCEK